MALIADKCGERESMRPRLHEGEAPPRRYFDLIRLGFSPETSAIVAEAPVSLECVTRLLLPDAEQHSAGASSGRRRPA